MPYEDRYRKFEQYLASGEPGVEERARNWSMAIGLQDVDRLKPSEFLLEQAKANIEGKISSKEVGKRLEEYYSQKSVQEKAEADGTFEADWVADRINLLLAEKAFTFSPMELSRILFRKGKVELAELIYNPTQGDNDNRDITIDNLVSRAVPQKPDIVLRLTKKEPATDLKLTYLFDAKYRIDGKEKGVDMPPEDAINQMHCYRDAIYYTEHDQQGLKKEVIGGYILFPRNGDPANLQVARFYKSIDDVNIGAFPLRPKDLENRKLLEEFIHRLLTTRATALLSQDNIIPQKGLRYIEDDTILGKDELCLVCYTSADRIKAVKNALVYYVRTGKRNGAIRFATNAVSIKYVILIPLKKDEDSCIFTLKDEEAEIFRGEVLAKKGFSIKDEYYQEPYLVYSLTENYQRVKFDNLESNTHIPANAKVSGRPFFIKMNNLH